MPLSLSMYLCVFLPGRQEQRNQGKLLRNPAQEAFCSILTQACHGGSLNMEFWTIKVCLQSLVHSLLLLSIPDPLLVT